MEHRRSSLVFLLISLFSIGAVLSITNHFVFSSALGDSVAYSILRLPCTVYTTLLPLLKGVVLDDFVCSPGAIKIVLSLGYNFIGFIFVYLLFFRFY